MTDKFATDFYEAHDILTCPNGDKVRSDDEGAFCWIDGARVPYPVVAPMVVIQPVVVTPPTLTEKPAATKKGG